ncbi:hypothetical protein [Desulfovibrio sp.]|uniref:hypothetical protein n=1 Tax=Desulfovibrio sp. TaxID=885 RepID=UPI0023C5C82D|nr:hypothetical protein [Desulfovibrio sp.]MDE7240626.1 hypothetical protein [Desulfovibrio sp.]
MLDKYVKSFGLRGKCYRFRDHHLIKNMKAAHLLSAIAWGGGAFAMQALNILRTSAAGDVPSEMIARCSWFIDTWVVMPGLFGCILTGLFYSIFTSLGFFRFAWIIYKWLISTSALFWGLLFWSGLGDGLIGRLGNSVAADFLLFIRGLILPDSVWASIVQTCIILSMCLVSIYRPLTFWPHKQSASDAGKAPLLPVEPADLDGGSLPAGLCCPHNDTTQRNG